MFTRQGQQEAAVFPRIHISAPGHFAARRIIRSANNDVSKPVVIDIASACRVPPEVVARILGLQG